MTGLSQSHRGQSTVKTHDVSRLELVTRIEQDWRLRAVRPRAATTRGFVVVDSKSSLYLVISGLALLNLVAEVCRKSHC